MKKAYIQPTAEILKFSSLIDDFLTTSSDYAEQEKENVNNGMDKSDAEITPSIPSFW